MVRVASVVRNSQLITPLQTTFAPAPASSLTVSVLPVSEAGYGRFLTVTVQAVCTTPSVWHPVKASAVTSPGIDTPVLLLALIVVVEWLHSTFARFVANVALVDVPVMFPLYSVHIPPESVHSWVAEAVPAPINAMSAATAIAARARFLIHFTGYTPFVNWRAMRRFRIADMSGPISWVPASTSAFLTD